MSGRLGYRAALQWLLDNDDCTWLDDESPIPSVALCLVADIFGKSTESAIADLKRRYDKESGQ